MNGAEEPGRPAPDHGNIIWIHAFHQINALLALFSLCTLEVSQWNVLRGFARAGWKKQPALC
jgi:hypothetical protein